MNDNCFKYLFFEWLQNPAYSFSESIYSPQIQVDESINLDFFESAMANTQSALKNIRKNRTNYLRNRSISSRLKTLDKVFLSSVESKDKEAASQAAKSLISALDKASKSKLVHFNKVARKKSRCAALLASL